jgi:hypothetical protein
MYLAFGLLQPGNDFTIDAAAARLATRFPDATISREGDQVTVSQDEWEMELALATGPHVLAESVEIAEKIGGGEDAGDIASCASRVEIWSETPDPMMEHFNEFLFVVEVLQSFRGLIAVDPKEPAFM